jgi:hypothetical protein
MRLTRRGATVSAALFALTAMVTLAACSDDNNAPTRVYLTGNYTVTGLWQGAPGDTPDPQPVGPATAVLTTTNYSIDIPAIETVTAGTYQAFSDGTFTQDGTVTISGGAPQAIQCTGTFTDVSDVVTVNTLCLGQRTVTVLARD